MGIIAQAQFTIADLSDATAEVVVGTQTAATNVWTGNASFSELKDGQTILYWLPFAGTSTAATLNLTLANGTTTGAKNIYINGTTRCSNQVAVGNITQMTYRENTPINGSTTLYTGWWISRNQDTTTNYYDRIAYKASVTATGAIAAGRIGVFNSAGKLMLLSTTAFDVTKPILYVGTAYTASALTQTNNYIAWGTAFSLANTVSSYSGIAGAAVYIKGTLNGSLFTPAAGVLTTVVPTAEDGYTYILLGLMSTATAAVLAPEHPMFRYYNGAFKTISQISYEAYVAAEEAQDEIDNLAIGGRNLIWRTLNPSAVTGSRPRINGLDDAEIVSSSGSQETVDHGLKTTNTGAVRTYLRFGSTSVTDGSMLGLEAGETYTFSCDAEFKLLSGTQTATTYNVYAYLYTLAEGGTAYAAGTLAAGTLYVMGTYPQALKGTVLSKRVEWTFTVPANAVKLYFLFACERTTASNYAADDYIELRNLKLERGNRATDWTAAPEDEDEEIELKLSSVRAQISTEADSIRSEVQANYALASDMTQVKSQVSTLSEQTESNYTWAVTRINQMQQDMEHAQEATEEQLAIFRTYMTFDENGLAIGKTGNPFTFRVVNDRLAFYMNDTEVAYLSNNKLYVTQAEILSKLIIGKFAFEPQSNGNLSLIYNG